MAQYSNVIKSIFKNQYAIVKSAFAIVELFYYLSSFLFSDSLISEL